MVNSELSGKVAIVTGAGRMRGIGRATAVILARMGSHVVVPVLVGNPETFPMMKKKLDGGTSIRLLKKFKPKEFGAPSGRRCFK
ncbi:MAG: hypothetical protein Ct9H300mP19_00440 [Dehalococcoidia bacterium]|nr:MAG: hypothetical protein Ct9H300mP19_00440 [Dehalococcoidia bacterium]